MLKQLVAWVGQDKFMAGVREYFGKHAWSNTVLTDLLTELEAASGRDLSDWSAKWLETAGVNTLHPIIETDDSGTLTRLAIRQTAVAEYPTLRPHRLAVGFYTEDADGALRRTHRLELDVDGELTEVPEAAGLAQPDLLLLNDDDLAYAKIRLDPKSQRTATRRLRDIADSLPRTLVWAAAWDGTRDGEIPARNYVELVLQNIAHESDSTVVQVLLRQLATTLAFYVDPADRAAMTAAAADSLWELSRDAGAGSDSQLQFLKSFAAHAVSDRHLDTLAALLSGEASLEGLEIDSDLRWELLTGLVVGGRAGQEQIDEELRRDPTATGQLAAAHAVAALPDPEAKAAAWASIVDSSEMPNAAQRSAIAGFSRVHDAAVLEPYVEKYFDSVREVWQSRTHEIAQQIVVGLYPSRLTRQETIDRTDEFLASLGDEAPALRRLILESRDGLVRALRAQAVDK